MVEVKAKQPCHALQRIAVSWFTPGRVLGWRWEHGIGHGGDAANIAGRQASDPDQWVQTDELMSQSA